MRKSRKEAAETRERIVDTASAEFRRHGIDGTGLSGLMAAAGLTHGGFYRHFGSKDELVAETCVRAAEGLIAAIAAARADATDQRGLDAILADYLSAGHRDDPAKMCPFAALGGEIARGSDTVRGAATEGFGKLVDVIAAELDEPDPAVARGRALAALCTMVGAMTMSRMVSDPALSDEILRETRTQLTRGSE
ncbi:TetR/AcrR family transcriptional regulator [Inquilinus sp.]|jgi:TetR/AcrR family transcriptional repressor of nem operon|uniref:TetR/AcrR family transcriptional regulator n=1 Tax=Inquilinus sp. TaxID=1932117 RepID=UPI003784D0E1